MFSYTLVTSFACLTLLLLSAATTYHTTAVVTAASSSINSNGAEKPSSISKKNGYPIYIIHSLIPVITIPAKLDKEYTAGSCVQDFLNS